MHQQGGQTREHAQLLKSLGVRELVVAVNKLELLNWDQSRSTSLEWVIRQVIEVIAVPDSISSKQN